MTGQLTVFALPWWLLGVGCAGAGLWAVAGLCCAIGAVIAVLQRGVVFGIALTACLWVAGASVLAAGLSVRLPGWLAGLALLAAVIALFRWAVLLRLKWADRSDKAPRMIEWHWVYTGWAFAAQHRLYERLGAVWLVAGYVVLQFCLKAAAIWWMAPGVSPFWAFLVLVVLCGLYVLAFLTLIARMPAAYPLTWCVILMGLPLSVPVAVYWADGVRPNLIYRHRFERLRLPYPTRRAG